MSFVLFKHPKPAIIWGTTIPSCFVHTWQGAESLAPATKSHVNIQKWSEHVVFLTFWLQNVLRATACTFRPLNCQNWSARRFTEPALRPWATKHWKNTDVPTFLLFGSFWILLAQLVFLSDSFSSLSVAASVEHVTSNPFFQWYLQLCLDGARNQLITLPVTTGTSYLRLSFSFDFYSGMTQNDAYMCQQQVY